MEDSGGKVIWVLAGCVGLLTVALCVGGGIALFMVTGEPGTAGPNSSPGPGPMPGPAPGPMPMPPPPGPAGLDLAPRAVVATVTSGTGRMPVRVGSECRFAVTADSSGGSVMCNAQVTCGAQLLYGGPSAGFFPCTVHGSPTRHVVGRDAQTTAGDRDAAMSLDTIAGTLSVRDDTTGNFGAYTVEARVLSIQ